MRSGQETGKDNEDMDTRATNDAAAPAPYDVIIVGYGPTGATLANLLGLRGFTVAVVDKLPDVYDKPRAITADHEVMRIFQACGLADEISADTIPHPGTDYIGLHDQVIKRFYPAPAPHPLSWEPTWMFVQPTLERSLRRGVERFDTVHTYLAHELVRYEEREEDVVVHLNRLSDDRPVTLRGRYLVGSDGARSVVRRQMNGTIEDLAFDEWWIVVDAWLRGDAGLPPRATQYCHPWRPGSFIVGPGDLRRWEIKILPDERPESFESRERLLEVLSHFVDVSMIEIHRVAIYRFHALVVEDWGHRRVFLMGDAAHQTPPFMGQGMCAGIRDAGNFAWKLEGVMRRGYHPRLLHSYTQERKPHVRTLVAHAKTFGQIIGELDLEAARRRDELLGEQLRNGTAETIRQKFVPGLETGVLGRRADGTLACGAGDLFVQPWVRSGTQRVRMDDCLGRSFSLVLADAQALEWIDARVQQALQRVGASVVLLGQAPGVRCCEEEGHLARDWFRERGARVALVRPDHYAFGCADDPAALRELCDQLVAALVEEPAMAA